MKRFIATFAIVVLILGAFVSCSGSGDTETPETVATEGYTYRTLSFEKPKIWIETSESNENRMILKSSDYSQDPSSVVISAISNLDMTPLEYANLVKEELDIPESPEDMTFGDKTYTALKANNQIPTFNFFLKFDDLTYLVVYANMNDEITENAKAFLSSIEHIK
ncbi:MAG TPA: hypothetical protein PKV16_03185 [Caldisericia bacterium]|nr:hypothetical protein [Caldisericia bacterium]HPF48315.1 hypothetical protein [Caldisericia bacterium]HPI83506.1 hypothetical protein [Caldisericia bacterium]HPQ92768.1 hypothetical protein [Caldisericia bacterium]HRV74134.1 hypothetical protein [Caldisericia bacterium]